MAAAPPSQRVGVDPKTKAPVTGTVKKTIYPKDLTPAQIDQAGELALKSAVAKEPGAKLDPYGTKLKADGSLQTASSKRP